MVYVEGKPTFFARIESISQDVKRDWYQVKMLVLQVPLMVITWILREPYINGEEFTMGGRPIKVVRVEAPEESEQEREQELEAIPEGEKPSPMEKGEPSSSLPEKGKILSFKDRRKKDHPS